MLLLIRFMPFCRRLRVFTRFTFDLLFVSFERQGLQVFSFEPFASITLLRTEEREVWLGPLAEGLKPGSQCQRSRRTRRAGRDVRRKRREGSEGGPVLVSCKYVFRVLCWELRKGV